MSKVKPIVLEIGDSNKFRVFNDLDWDTAEERNQFLSDWINDKLCAALDTGELKAEFEMWHDARARTHTRS